MLDINLRLQVSENIEFSAEVLHVVECAVEDIVSCALLQLFDEVTVIDVTLSSTLVGQLVASFSIQGI